MDILSEFVHKDYNSSVAISGFGQSRHVVSSDSMSGIWRYLWRMQQSSRATASRFLHLASWTVFDIGSNCSIQVAPSKVPFNQSINQ